MREPHAILKRRLAPRVAVETFCTELVEDGERAGLVIDVSPEGLRIERPYLGGPTPREISIELEVPAFDEVIWTRAAVCFDHIRRAPRGVHGGPFAFLRTTGLHIVAAASRDLRLLGDCVVELRRARAADEDSAGDLLGAACYARG